MSEPTETLPPFGSAGRCLKCGREIDPAESMCEVCNRAGMTAPASTQMHGTVAVAVIGAVIGMGVLASLVVGDPGPYAGQVVDVGQLTGTGVVATVEVANEGTRAGRARCQLTAVDAGGGTLAQTVAVSPEIEAGTAVRFEAVVSELAADPAEVTVTCQ